MSVLIFWVFTIQLSHCIDFKQGVLNSTDRNRLVLPNLIISTITITITTTLTILILELIFSATFKPGNNIFCSWKPMYHAHINPGGNIFGSYYTWN